MMMYDPKTDERTFDDPKRRRAAFPALTEADHALAYAREAFKRLTGYPAEERRMRSRRTDDATAYAEDIFARMKGRRPAHPYDFDYHLEGPPVCDGDAVQEGAMEGRADRGPCQEHVQAPSGLRAS